MGLGCARPRFVVGIAYSRKGCGLELIRLEFWYIFMYIMEIHDLYFVLFVYVL